jgi:signal peptidase I
LTNPNRLLDINVRDLVYVCFFKFTIFTPIYKKGTSVNIDFALLLIVLTVISGLVTLFDKLLGEKKRQQTLKKMPWFTEQCRSLFPVFLLVLVLRSFVIEPYRIPSGSLKPSLLDGDFIIVNKYTYGLHLPVLNTQILPINTPQRGDIMVFHWPVDPTRYDFIKRVIGLPGDHIRYVDKTLYINDKKMTQTYIRPETDNDGHAPSWSVQLFKENLDGHNHEIFIIPTQKAYNLEDIIVPPHMYFMMGDNRDNSEDSRYWGFVPEHDIVGKAMRVALSWDSEKHWFRWNRFAMKIN